MSRHSGISIPKIPLSILVSVFALFLFAFGVLTGVVQLDFKNTTSAAYSDR
jgi:hypothetical protein